MTPKPMTCFFVSDLHGVVERYRRLFDALSGETPRAVFMGGDLLPMPFPHSGQPYDDFVADFLVPELRSIREQLGERYPHVFMILGNDDLRIDEASVLEAEALGLWEYMHARRSALNGYPVYGYAHVPPTPFLLKDWERYDVSRFVDPGCVSPEEGRRSVPCDPRDVRFATIKDELEILTGKDDLTSAILLFHAPPYRTNLDRADLDGALFDHVPVDVNVGSIAIRRFIEERQPLITLHGHIHESAELTGRWEDRIGRTFMFSAAHAGPELALVRFDPAAPERATRELL
jgi:Icc-related predicted phosphoesterase